MQLLLPGIRVFLDVDNLESIDLIEEYIEQSQVIMIFLSKGYFFSKNCMREVEHTLKARRPIALVHETDASKGGAPVEQLRRDIPPECLEGVFGLEGSPRPIIAYHRVSQYQVCTHHRPHRVGCTRHVQQLTRRLESHCCSVSLWSSSRSKLCSLCRIS
jgi:hypothetical protein